MASWLNLFVPPALDRGGDARRIVLLGEMSAMTIDLHKAALERIEPLVKPVRACYCARDGGISIIGNRRFSYRHSYTSYVGRNVSLIFTRMTLIRTEPQIPLLVETLS